VFCLPLWQNTPNSRFCGKRGGHVCAGSRFLCFQEHFVLCFVLSLFCW
jgi:hypothetical protein